MGAELAIHGGNLRYSWQWYPTVFFQPALRICPCGRFDEFEARTQRPALAEPITTVITDAPPRTTAGLPLARCSPGRNRGPSAFTLGFAPPRTRPADARQSGDRSRTLIENYAPGITGLQPASSLAIRDLVSHVRTFPPQVKRGLRPQPLIAGPARSSLRCGRPARRRHTTRPDDRGRNSSGHRASHNLIKLLGYVRAGLLRGRSSPRSITTGKDRFASLTGSRQAASLDRWRSP